MSDAKPFATVCEFDENVWIVDSPNEHRSCDVYAVCGKDKAEAERIASVLNDAVSRERRESAAVLLDRVRALLNVADWDCDMQGKSHRDTVRRWFDAHIAQMDAALRKGDV